MNQRLQVPIKRIILPASLSLVLLAVWASEIYWTKTPNYTHDYDPQMAYFLNSLAIFKSEPYQYFDHPGTPVELIGTFLIGAMKPLFGLNSDAYIPFLLNNPEKFFHIGYAVLMVASGITIILLSAFALQINLARDRLWAAAIAALFFIVMPRLSYSTLFLWSHNSFTFAFGSLLLLWIYVALLRIKKPSAQLIATIGFSAGVLAAVQLYFVTWIVGIAIAVWLNKYLSRRRFVEATVHSLIIPSSSIAGFIISTLPILHRYREFVWWVRGLMLHQGRYGRGEAGFASLTRLSHNFRTLFSAAPGPYIASLAILVFLFYAAWAHRSKLFRNAGWVALSIGLTVQLILTHLLILKHPATTYLLAVAAILPIMFCLVLYPFQESPGRAGRWISMISLLILIAYVLGAYQAAMRQHQATVRYGDLIKEGERMRSRAAQQLGKPEELITVLWSYGATSSCYGLRFGSIYTGGVFKEEIASICPRDWRYDVWSKVAILPDGPTDTINSEEWDLLIVPAGRAPLEIERLGLWARSEFGQELYILRESPARGSWLQ